MRPSFSHLNDLWSVLAVDELVRTGVTCFVISPGSRSTPLVYAVSQNKRVVPLMHFDERGAAFYALGHAKATGIPAALICTSGTAAANYFPAIIEASQDHVPMIILTADRPPELRQTGANQTIDQFNLYGKYVRFQMDIPCPDEKIPAEFILTTIDQAVYRSFRSPAGPVHLNFMFREPLAPTGRKVSFGNYLKSIAGWLKNSSPYTEYTPCQSTLTKEALTKIEGIIDNSRFGIVIAGKLKAPDSTAVLSLSKQIGWPIFPDIASGLRLGVKNSHAISFYDMLLHSEKFQKFLPDTILHFGCQPVSKRLLQFLVSTRPRNYIRIANYPERHDPNHQVTWRFEVDITEFCRQIIERVSKKSISQHTLQIRNLSKIVNETLSKLLETAPDDRITEPTVARIISKHISKDSALFLSSSLPVRTMDIHAVPDGASVPVEYNRGVSGIDGTIASAVGYANSIRKAVTLVMGDLAFLHDLNSLALVRQSQFPLTIVIVNNDGGGIFSFLPVAKMGKSFEPFFGTPHGLSFEQSAEQFHIPYYCTQSITDFTKIYIALQKKKSSSIIEISTNRQANYKLNEQITRAIKSALDRA